MIHKVSMIGHSLASTQSPCQGTHCTPSPKPLCILRLESSLLTPLTLTTHLSSVSLILLPKSIAAGTNFPKYESFYIVLKICQGGSIPSGSVSNSSAGTQGTAPLPSWAASPGGFPVTPDAALPAAWPQFLHATLSVFVIHTAFSAVKMSFYFISTWQSLAYSNGYVP